MLCFLKSVHIFYLFHLKVVKLAALKLQIVCHFCQAAIEMSAKLFYWFLMTAVINYPHDKTKERLQFHLNQQNVLKQQKCVFSHFWSPECPNQSAWPSYL